MSNENILRAYDPERQFEQLEKASDKAAEAVYKEFLLSETAKILFSQLVVEHAVNKKVSIAQAEHRARSDKKYENHINGLAVAKKELFRARATYENLRALAEARRTQETSARYVRGDIDK